MENWLQPSTPSKDQLHQELSHVTQAQFPSSLLQLSLLAQGSPG